MKKVLTLTTLLALLFTSAGFAQTGGLSVGDYAPDFKLKNIDGKTISMADYKNAKGFIVTFTCNTCPWANGYEQRIMDLDKKYASKGFPVIAINPNDIQKMPDDSMEAMVSRSKDKGYTFPYLRDDSQDIAKAYGATKTPHLYVLKKEGSKYKVEFIGAIDDNPRDGSKVTRKYVEEAVDAILAGKKVETTSIKAIGCTIKWSES